MPKYLRGGTRLLAALAVAALLMPLSATVMAQTSGRDYSRCVQACNDARRACNDRCNTDCKAMFPNDSTARNACISACKNTTCNVESEDCKLACKAIKNGETLEEP